METLDVRRPGRPRGSTRARGSPRGRAATRMTASTSLREKPRDVLPGNRQADPQPNHSPTAATSTLRVRSRTKGRVRYDRMPTGEVVASIIQDEPGCITSSPTTTRATSSAESGSRRGRVTTESSCVLPEDYPVNQSNVTVVVEEAHRATQSMRILLTSMREELRRAGGLSDDGAMWTNVQLSQRRNVAHRLAVAYQSYRKSIHDIENLRFRDGNSPTANSGVNSRPPSGVIVLTSDSDNSSVTQRGRHFSTRHRHVKADSGSSSSNIVIDLTE